MLVKDQIDGFKSGVLDSALSRLTEELNPDGDVSTSLYAQLKALSMKVDVTVYDDRVQNIKSIGLKKVKSFTDPAKAW